MRFISFSPEVTSMKQDGRTIAIPRHFGKEFCQIFFTLRPCGYKKFSFLSGFFRFSGKNARVEEKGRSAAGEKLTESGG
jgi:hypothetical protein